MDYTMFMACIYVHVLCHEEIWCFEQADSSELAAKTRIYRLSIQFRLNLTSVYHQIHVNDQAVVEMKGAQLMRNYGSPS